MQERGQVGMIWHANGHVGVGWCKVRDVGVKRVEKSKCMALSIAGHLLVSKVTDSTGV